MSVQGTSNEGGEDVRQALLEAYGTAGDAYRGKDADALLALITPDFQQQMPDGQVIPRDLAEAALRDWFSTPDAVTAYDVRLGPVTVRGRDALVEVTETVRTRFDAPDGSHERVQANTSKVTWTQTPAGWRIRRSDYLTASLVIDGQPVKPLYTG